MSSSYRLVYFDGRGVVEVSRFLFHLNKISFIDERVSFADFGAKKTTGEFSTNLDRLPLLCITDSDKTVTLGQSKTIERYLANKFGFNGSNDIEAALVDMICEHVRDIRQKYSDARLGKTGEALDAAKSAYLSTDLPQWLAKLEKVLPGGPYSVGNKVSVADLTIFQIVYDYFDQKAEVEAIVGGLPKLKAVADNVKSLLQDYLAARAVTSF